MAGEARTSGSNLTSCRAFRCHDHRGSTLGICFTGSRSFVRSSGASTPEGPARLAGTTCTNVPIYGVGVRFKNNSRFCNGSTSYCGTGSTRRWPNQNIRFRSWTRGVIYAGGCISTGVSTVLCSICLWLSGSNGPEILNFRPSWWREVFTVHRSSLRIDTGLGSIT